MSATYRTLTLRSLTPVVGAVVAVLTVIVASQLRIYGDPGAAYVSSVKAQPRLVLGVRPGRGGWVEHQGVASLPPGGQESHTNHRRRRYVLVCGIEVRERRRWVAVADQHLPAPVCVRVGAHAGVLPAGRAQVRPVMRESQEQIPVCVTPLGPRQTQKPRRADVLPVGFFDCAEERRCLRLPERRCEKSTSSTSDFCASRLLTRVIATTSLATSVSATATMAARVSALTPEGVTI